MRSSIIGAGRAVRALASGVVLLWAVPLTGCSSSTAKVDVREWVEDALPGAGTWTWAAKQANPVGGAGDSRIDDALHAVVERAVASGLATKGYREVQAGGAELAVVYHVGVGPHSYDVQHGGRRAALVCSASMDCESGWRWGPYGPPALGRSAEATVSYLEGSLVVEIVRRATGEPLWTGTITDDVTDRAITKAMLERAVGRLIEELPSAAP